MSARKIYVWERHSTSPSLDGYIGWTAYEPRGHGSPPVVWFTIHATVPLPDDWSERNAVLLKADALVSDLVAAREARILNALLGETTEENPCEGHESLDGAHMGETVFCDGSCIGRN